MTKVAVVIFTTLFLSACSSVGTKNVQQASVEASSNYQDTYDDVWEAAIEWFATKNIPIEKIDKDSGLLTSKYGLAADQRIVNCGEPTGNIGLYRSHFEDIDANINVLVRSTKTGTRATINVFGNVHVVLRNGLGLVGQTVARCYSTGSLETEFHRFISENSY